MGLILEDVSHAFDGVDVVRGASFRVRPGEVSCLLGPSGCGKTTLLRLAAGLEILKRGRIQIGSRIVDDAAAGRHTPPEKRHVGLMFQDYALLPHLTVLGNVIFGIQPRVAGRQAWARQSLARIGLADYADSYPHTLSGGQQQRCALLRALAPEPEVLLLDEPFSGLDVTLRAQVREETANLLRETGVATLAVTHDPEEAMFISDRLLVMNDGRILQQGTPEEIYLHPADPFVAGLFGPVNRLEGVVTAGRVDTPFGSLAVSGVIDGVRAVVLIRPEGISIGRSDPGASARVTGARMLGRSSHLRLVLEGVGTALEALVPGVVLPGEGTPVTLTLDTRLAFVFPAG